MQHTIRLAEVHTHREVVNFQITLQLVLNDNLVAIPPLAALQRLRVLPNIREARNHVSVYLYLDVSGVPQHLPNDYTDNGRVYHEYLIDHIFSE